MADGILSRKTLRARAPRREVTRLAVTAALSIAFSAVSVVGQTHEVTVDGESFRKTADGLRLAGFSRGLRVELIRTVGAWAEVSFAGWVPTSSLGATTREGHDRIVTRGGGQDLRDAPSGDVLARLLQGLLLDRVTERETWTQVSRSGWVRLSSLAPLALSDLSPARPPSAPDIERPPALVSSGRRLMIGENPIDVHSSPEGDTVAVVRSGTPITVVERGNRWTRVRVEGWVRSDRLVTTDLDSALVEVSAGGLRANPGDYQGMRVRWTVQFIALERAEPERTDFYEGEPFILARAPDPSDGFIYVTVPPELLEAVEDLKALETIDILARIRTGRSTLMGVPVLDLLALF